MAINTLNDVIDRLKREGDLTRNSGTNSLKSVKDVLLTQAELQNKLLDKFELYFDRAEADRLQAKSKGLQPAKSNKVTTELEKVTKEQNEKRSGLLSSVGKGAFMLGGGTALLYGLNKLTDKLDKFNPKRFLPKKPNTKTLDIDPKNVKFGAIKAIGKRFAPVAALLGLIGVVETYNTKLETAITEGNTNASKTRLLLDSFGIVTNKAIFGTLETATDLILAAVNKPFSEEWNNGKTNPINEALKKLRETPTDFSKASEAVARGFTIWSDAITRDINNIANLTKKIGKSITDAIPDITTEEIISGVPNDQPLRPPVSNIDSSDIEGKTLTRAQKRMLSSFNISKRDLANMNEVELAKLSREKAGFVLDPDSWLGVSIFNRAERLDLLKIRQLQARADLARQSEYFTEDGIPVAQKPMDLPEQPLVMKDVKPSVNRLGIPRAELFTNQLNAEQDNLRALTTPVVGNVNTVVDNSRKSVNTDNSITSITQANSGLTAGQQIQNEVLNF